VSKLLTGDLQKLYILYQFYFAMFTSVSILSYNDNVNVKNNEKL